jgi:hypothetical protein
VVVRAQVPVGVRFVRQARVVRAHGIDWFRGRERVEKATEHDAVPQTLAERLCVVDGRYTYGSGTVRGERGRRRDASRTRRHHGKYRWGVRESA